MKKIYSIILISLLAVATVNAAPIDRNKKNTAKVDSVAIMIEKANKGDAQAQNTVARWYYYGHGSIKQDYKQALQYWALAAKQDNVDAIAGMAMCYQFGHGTKRDSVMAVGLYKAALKKGNKKVISMHEKAVEKNGSLFSCQLLKECYHQGIGVEKNNQKYAYYMEKIAEKGDVEEQFNVAMYYLNTQQADKAAPWFKKAAKQGKVGAIYYDGFLMYNGQGVAQDKQKAVTRFQQAAEKGFPMADYQLGRIYYTGDGAEQNYDMAAKYLRKAAGKHIPEAQWLLAQCYIDGKGVDQNYYFAAQWLAEAYPSHKKEYESFMKANENTTFGTYLKGLKYYYIDKNYDEAINCFKVVDKKKVAEGKTMLAVCYANKDYAKRNTKKAVKLFKQVASTSPAAAYYLSSMYESGTGVNKDADTALQLLTKAAEGGVAYAQCKLGDKYMTGEGVSRDFAKAANLYLKAEEQGHLTPESAKNLIECYNRKITALPDLDNAEKRIEQLGKQKMSDRLIKMLGNK